MNDDVAKSGALRTVGLALLNPTAHENVEERFVRSVIAGEPWAERELFERYAPMVHGALRRCVGPGHDIDDLMQDVFLTVFLRVKTLRDFTALRSFVYSVAIRSARWELRRRRTRNRHSSVGLESAAFEGVGRSDPEVRDFLTRIQSILDGMKAKYRMVFVLHRLEDQPVSEIADAMDVSVATVNRWIKRAVRQIEREIDRDERLAGVLGTVRSR